MDMPWGDDAVDDSSYNRCDHGVLESELCWECDFEVDYEDPFDPDAEVKVRRENPREDE